MAKKLRYKMLGGSFYQIVGKGKRVRRQRGDIFEAEPREVQAGRHQMECLDPEQEEESAFVLERPQVLKAVHKGGGRYNVEDEEGNILNVKYLSKAQAEAMVEGKRLGTDDEGESEPLKSSGEKSREAESENPLEAGESILD